MQVKGLVSREADQALDHLSAICHHAEPAMAAVPVKTTRHLDAGRTIKKHRTAVHAAPVVALDGCI
jgi:hypothetical protein